MPPSPCIYGKQVLETRSFTLTGDDMHNTWCTAMLLNSCHTFLERHRKKVDYTYPSCHGQSTSTPLVLVLCLTTDAVVGCRATFTESGLESPSSISGEGKSTIRCPQPFRHVPHPPPESVHFNWQRLNNSMFPSASPLINDVEGNIPTTDDPISTL